MYQIKKYIQFLIRSKNEHGVHSPFVFDLVTKCFYEKDDYSDYSKLKAYRKYLLVDTTLLSITDFGSGSKVFTSNKRTVSQIARTSGTSLKRSKLLYRLVRYLKSNTILELGTSLGIGTYAMSLGNPNAKITSIEGCPEVSSFTKAQFQKHAIENVDMKVGAFSKVLPTLVEPHWDLVFLDGHHEKEATLTYFNQLVAHAHNDSVFILDDIHWSQGMNEAWETIKNHPQVTVTIDTFFWGLVFFRTEQVKEHFTIRV